VPFFLAIHDGPADEAIDHWVPGRTCGLARTLRDRIET